MRRWLSVAAACALALACSWGATVSAGAAATGGKVATATTAPPDEFTPVDTVPVDTTPTVTIPTTTTSTSTTTTLPSAVTTLPPGCPSAPVAQSVFVGRATAVDEVSVTYRVDQVRAGTVDAFLRDGLVEVRYGGDARYLEEGSDYIVGVVVADAAASLLASTVRDDAVVMGEPEGLGVGPDCPEFEPVARTLTIDGTEVPTNLLGGILESPVRLVAALVLPALLVLVLLVGAVWLRRAARP